MFDVLYLAPKHRHAIIYQKRERGLSQIVGVPPEYSIRREGDEECVDLDRAGRELAVFERAVVRGVARNSGHLSRGANEYMQRQTADWEG